MSMMALVGSRPWNWPPVLPAMPTPYVPIDGIRRRFRHSPPPTPATGAAL
jgi:hypothetical protein